MGTIIFDMYEEQLTEFDEIFAVQSEIPSQILSFFEIISNHFFTDSDHLLDDTISITF